MRLLLHRDAFTFDLICWSNNRFAVSISPDRKRNKQKIENNERRDVRLAADAESVAMQTFAQNKVHAIPRHEYSEKTDDAGNSQTKLCPPAGEPAV